MVAGDLGREPENEGARSLKTAATVLRALRLLAEAPAGLSSQDLGVQLGKSASTGRYMINTLCEAGYAVRTTDGRCSIAAAPPWGTWAVAWDELAVHASLPEDDPLGVLPEAVTEIYRRTRQRSYLVDRTTPVLATVSDVRGHQGLARHPGLTGPIGLDRAHSLALTRVLLAVSPSYLEAVTGQPLAALTAYTLTDPEYLERELERVRRDGHAIEIEESAEGFVTVAAPVPRPSGASTVAIGLSASVRRFTAAADELVSTVTEVAERARCRWARSHDGRPR